MMYSPSNSGGKRQMEETVSGNKKRKNRKEIPKISFYGKIIFMDCLQREVKKTYCLGCFEKGLTVSWVALDSCMK